MMFETSAIRLKRIPFLRPSVKHSGVLFSKFLKRKKVKKMNAKQLLRKLWRFSDAGLAIKSRFIIRG